MSDKKVRSGQILSPFGVGQIVNFPKEVSLMVGGLNLWDEQIEKHKIQNGYERVDETALRIVEPRLQKLCNVEYFVKPFSYKTSGDKNVRLTIPAVRFPGWHYCSHPSCGRMQCTELLYASDELICENDEAHRGRKSPMIPVRFVAACNSGHIQDVPFKEWVHDGPTPNDKRGHELYYRPISGNGDLGSILITCSCGASRTLAGLMNVKKNDSQVFDSALARIGLDKEDKTSFSEETPNNHNEKGQYCKGYRPWLGPDGVSKAIPCREHLQVLIRGASNVHYSNIGSAIYLPKVSQKANEHVAKLMESNYEAYQKYYENFLDNTAVWYPMLETTEVVKKKLMTKEELLKCILAELEMNSETVLDEDLLTETLLRHQEYEFMLAGRTEENTDFKAIKKTFNGYSQKDFLEKYFDCVVLVEKMRETRVFKGFSRIDPSNLIDKSELSAEPVKWLPAIQVYGEGIFLKFKDEIIDSWLRENSEHFQNVCNRYHAVINNWRPLDLPEIPSPAFVAIHTFAHQLIKRLCYQCGYGSSSLRERIYFSNDEKLRMNGLLIYTSSSDADGTLGGLVSQGREDVLGKTIIDALEETRWCSADPVCSDIGKSGGQGPDNVNGAACHNCCILPETSCESFNMLLDRNSVIGYLDSSNGLFDVE